MVEDINKNKPHFVTLALCLDEKFDGVQLRPCFNRWVAIVPARTNLLQLECPKCHAQDSFASFTPTEFNNG